MKTKNHLDALIDAALNKYDADELIKKIAEKATLTEKEYLLDYFARTCSYEGFFVVKVNSLSDMMKLEDFTTQNICTFYNEQQANLF